MDVPDDVCEPSSLKALAETIERPGARILIHGPKLLKSERGMGGVRGFEGLGSTDATAMADSCPTNVKEQASRLEFPEATTTVMPAATAASVRALPTSLGCPGPVPQLICKTAGLFRFRISQSMEPKPADIPLPLDIAKSVAPGATPKV